MKKIPIDYIVFAILTVAFLAACILGLVQGDTLRGEIADLRAQLAEAESQKAEAIEDAARANLALDELRAVTEAYTPVIENTAETVPAQEKEPVALTVAAPAPTTTEYEGQIKIGEFTVSHYCCCTKCTDGDGIGARGVPVEPWYSVAVDPKVIPLGTILYMDYGDGQLHEVRADDTGSAIKGYKIDLCVPDHQTGMELGVRHATVYMMKEAQ